MDLHSMAFEFRCAAQGVCHSVGLALEVHKLEPIGLHLFNPSGLPMREMREWILEEVLQWGVISSEDEVTITQPEPPCLGHCSYYGQPFPIRGVVSGLRWEELPAPVSYRLP